MVGDLSVGTPWPPQRSVQLSSEGKLVTVAFVGAQWPAVSPQTMAGTGSWTGTPPNCGRPAAALTPSASVLASLEKSACCVHSASFQALQTTDLGKGHPPRPLSRCCTSLWEISVSVHLWMTGWMSEIQNTSPDFSSLVCTLSACLNCYVSRWDQNLNARCPRSTP